MKVHNVIQGSPEWLQLRATAFTASEAPAMMGCSPYMTRTELLHQKHTGLAPEVPAATQRLFDNGHATEAQFRPIAEDIIGDDLYPVTGSIELDGMLLLASFDGLTMDYSIGFEHKLWSETNAAVIEMEGEPPIYHCWQMEHQMLVSGAEHILFATSDGTAEKSLVCRYFSKPERRAALIAGWKQFAADLAAYVPSVVTADKPTGKAPDTLPALRIEVTGMVTASNLAEFKETALAAIRSVNRDLTSDQDFADAEQSVKWCEEVETRLKAAKEHALSQTASIDQLFKTIDDISAEARKVRLELDKLVKGRKEELRQQIVAKASKALAAHLDKLWDRVGLHVNVTADFAGAVKGKRSLVSIEDAVSTVLAQAKIAANEQADLMEANIKTTRGEAHDWGFLFPDMAAVASKPAEDFANLLTARIAAWKEREEQRRQREAEAAAKAAQVVQQAAAPVVTPAAPVVTQRAPVASDATIKLGQINAYLAPIQITQAGLAQLGFDPVGKDKNAVLYRESDFPAMCQAIAKHVMGAVAMA
jgi:putative phage-type endonuclease